MTEPSDKRNREELATGFDNSYLVEAGAGAGKTAALISRIMGAIKRRIPITKIAAITFTDKAANELLMRIRENVGNELRAATGSKQDTAIWQEARDKLDTAPIGTIHSFCASLLRKRPIEAGVDPNFEVMDDVEANFLFEKTWKDWIAINLGKENQTLVEALQAVIELKQIKNLARALLENRDMLAVHKNKSRSQKPDFQTSITELEKCLSEAESLKQFCIKPEMDEGYQNFVGVLSNWDQIKTYLEIYPYLYPLDFNDKAKGNKNNWKPKEKKDEFARALSNFALFVKQYVAEAGEYVIDQLLLLLIDFIESYQGAKEAAGRLDFNDLLLLTRDMLADTDDKVARAYFQKAFDLIMVDEFQDTDPLQVEIALLLSEKKPIADRWDKVKPEPGKLFLVGDLKQSIYRFRRADIDVYKSVKKNIKDLKSISLVQNFRSCPELVAWFNACFKDLFNAETNNSRQPVYEDLSPPPDYVSPPSGKSHPGVWTLQIDGVDYLENESKRDVVRSLEAESIARFIENIVQEGWEVRDLGTKQWRPIEWKDIALLFRSRTGMEYFADALRSRNIPFVASGAGGQFERPECRSLIACLMAIDKPDDTVSLIGALRSTFFGISDQDILRAKLAGIKFDYTRQLPDKEEFLPFSPPFKILKELHETKNSGTISGLIGKLYMETGVLVLYTLEKDSAMPVANLLKMQEMARQFDSEVGASLGAFLDYLSEYEANSKLETPSGLASDEPCVKLMTVHGAKGLEFPMVILADMTTDDPKGPGVLLIDRKHNNILVKVGNIKSKGREEAENDEKEIHRVDEELRLLYVACTRARDYLVAPVPEAGMPKAFSEKAVEHILGKWRDQTHFYKLADTPSIRADEKYDAAQPESVYVPESAFETDPIIGWRESRKKLIEKLSRPNLFLRVTDLAKHKESVGLKTEADDRATDFGTFVHKLLEQVDFSRPETLEELAKQIPTKAGSGEIKRAINMVRRALETPLLKRAMKSPKLKKEFNVQYVAETGKLVGGIIDLVFEEEGNLIIVDYKTDPVKDIEEAKAKLEEGYRQQGRLYAEALEKCAGMKVSETHILFLKPDSPIALPCI